MLANAILDVRLQTMGMTDQEAMDLMVKQTFQETEEATAKLQRAKLSSCQLPTYYVGWREWLRVRDQYKQAKGAAFQLSEFHDQALAPPRCPCPPWPASSPASRWESETLEWAKGAIHYFETTAFSTWGTGLLGSATSGKNVLACALERTQSFKVRKRESPNAASNRWT